MNNPKQETLFQPTGGNLSSLDFGAIKLSTAQAAQVVGCTPAQLARLRREGRGPRVQSSGPRSHWYELDDLATWKADRPQVVEVPHASPAQALVDLIPRNERGALAHHLATMLLASGMSRDDLGKAMRVSDSAVNHWAANRYKGCRASLLVGLLELAAARLVPVLWAHGKFLLEGDAKAILFLDGETEKHGGKK